jgi:glycine oxidase
MGTKPSLETEVLVLGAGAIGLCVAWRLARLGRQVAVVDPDPGRGAIWAAAGMLAPASEAHFGDEAIVPLLIEAARVWEGFAEELEAESGAAFGYRRSGTLLVGKDAADRAEVSRILMLQRSLALEVLELDRGQLAELEPALASGLRFGLLAPNDHQVDTRALVMVLLGELERRGVPLVRSAALGLGDGAILELADGRRLEAEQLVLCPGAHLGELSGIDDLDLPTIRPVKGHVLRLFGAPLLERTVRGTVRGRSIYLVPRASGELVVGASVEERGFDARIQAGEVYRLLDDARRLLPGIDELELADASVGFRPGSPDNAPTIASLRGGSVVVATGHYRNGILLGPLSAGIVVDLLAGAEPAGLELLAASHRAR